MSGRPDISGYVLGELDPREAGRLRELERTDTRFAAEVARLREAVARVETLEAAQWEPVEPPPLAFVPEAPRPSRRGVRGFLGALARPLTVRPAFAAAAAALLLALGVAGGALLASGDSGDAGGGTQVALNPLGTAPATARASARIADGRMRLDVSGLGPTRKGAFYEVWMLRSPKELVSLGTFKVDARGRAKVTLPVTVDAKRFPVLDVSIEPADGNPSHSSVSVLRSKPIVS
jgi:anti-sigma-K factor RskA